jgi:hypothetical protein
MIGLTIVKLLTDSDALMALVPSDNIFPLIVNESIPLPWIAYRVESIESEYSKDGWVDDITDFVIATFSNDYANLQLITKEVRKALEMQYDSGTKKIRMTGYREESDGTIIGTFLSFKIEVTSY